MGKRLCVLFLTLIISICSMILFKNDKTICFADNDLIKSKSKSSILLNVDTDEVLYSNNELERLPIASMCKVMTLLICFEELDKETISLNQEITVSENASSMGGSQVFLEKNGVYPVSELLKCIVVASANDCCVAMAEQISGSEENFVELMNNRCEKLSMTNTHFVNCTGLPKVGQYSCAKDVAKMFSELIKHKEYFNYSQIWLDKIVHSNNRVTEISNTNKLVRFYDGCDGGKTGYTSEAGHCLVATAIRDSMRMISVVIGACGSKERFAEVSNMFNYSFSNYQVKKVLDCNTVLDKKFENVVCGKKGSLEVVPEENFSILIKKNKTKSLDYEYDFFEKVKAPILSKQKVGELKIFENGELIKSINILAKEGVSKKNYFDSLNDMVSNWSLI